MECTGRWSFVAIILYLAIENKALCQCQKKSNVFNENLDFTKLSGIPSSSDLYNSILTTAAENGVLSDLIPKLQGQAKIENLSKSPYTQDISSKLMSFMPTKSDFNAQEPNIFSSQSFREPTSYQNPAFATPCGTSFASNIIPSIPQSLPSIPPSSSNCISQISQILPLDNYSVCSANAGAVQPTPIMLQPQNQCNEINSYFYNQISEPISVPDLCSNVLNFPCQSLPANIECGELFDIISNLELPGIPQSAVFINDCPQTPLQVNVPPTSIPVPKVSVMSAGPTNCPISLPLSFSPDYSTNFSPFQYPMQPPIVLESSKSSLKKWLPLILIALLNDRGCNNGGGCSCCGCSCNGGGNKIPVPYPIPVPINNPVINPGSMCRNRDMNDWLEEEED